MYARKRSFGRAKPIMISVDQARDTLSESLRKRLDLRQCERSQGSEMPLESARYGMARLRFEREHDRRNPHRIASRPIQHAVFSLSQCTRLVEKHRLHA